MERTITIKEIKKLIGHLNIEITKHNGIIKIYDKDDIFTDILCNKLNNYDWSIGTNSIHRERILVLRIHNRK